MGIKLDWEIEADHRALKGLGEDPISKRARRAARLRILATIVAVIAVIGGIRWYIGYRLEEVNNRLEQNLRDTVIAEVTALRLGNWLAFADFQRSATDDWIRQQRDTFDEYQSLLQTNPNAQLIGQIRDVVIDDPRARVQIEEVIDGIPYTRVWFYWRYEIDLNDDNEPDGWRHVPFDPTFWGETDQYTGQSVIVAYQAVDRLLANQMGEQIDGWLRSACAALTCPTTLPLRIEIYPTGVNELEWNGWTLRMASPYANRARSDQPFSPELRFEVAAQLAERLVVNASVNQQRATYPADAYYLQQAVINWLVGRFAQIETNSFMIATFAENYGSELVGQMLAQMPADGGIGILSALTGQPLDQLNVDWRDFFTWRLILETQLIQNQQLNAVLEIYDSRDESIRVAAFNRYSGGISSDGVVTVAQPMLPASDGSPQYALTVRYADGSEGQVIFRLVEGDWRRAS